MNPQLNARTLPTVRPGEVPEELLEHLRERLQYGLPQTLDLEIVSMDYGRLVLQMTVQQKHLAVNGYLHAGSVVTLADTSCGFGCIAHLPEGAVNFTTVELKSNFLGTVTSGVLRSTAELRHSGRSTQVWDATVQTYSEQGNAAKTIALFRCTQIILYPKG